MGFRKRVPSGVPQAGLPYAKQVLATTLLNNWQGDYVLGKENTGKYNETIRQFIKLERWFNLRAFWEN